MAELEALGRAINSLSQRVREFPVGALSLEDLKPTEEKNQDLREWSKLISAHLLIIRAKKEQHMVPEEPEGDMDEALEILQKQTARANIVDTIIKLCLHSQAIHDIMLENQGPVELHGNLKTSLRQLFSLNYALSNVQLSLSRAMKKQLDLQIERPKVLFEYREFLAEQDQMRDQQLQQSNPENAMIKKKVQSKLMKINIMKRLITNMISSGHMMISNPILNSCLEKHRTLVTIETISEATREESPEDG